MNEHTLALRARDLAGHLNRDRWGLAFLALEAKQAGVPAWDSIIGQAVKRSPRTIREWARTGEIRQLFQVDGLTFDHYRRAAGKVDELDPAVLLELMQTAAAEGVTAEEFGRELSAQTYVYAHGKAVWEARAWAGLYQARKWRARYRKLEQRGTK